MSQQGPPTTPLAVVFLFHTAIEIPVAIQGVLSPSALPFLDLNNTTVAILKLFSALSFGTCVAALLCFSLPDFLPGKRALAIGLTIYHCIASTILYQAPRFIPHSFGAVCETYNITPENVWGTAHGIAGLGFVFWWQSTVALTAAVRKMQ